MLESLLQEGLLWRICYSALPYTAVRSFFSRPCYTSCDYSCTTILIIPYQTSMKIKKNRKKTQTQTIILCVSLAIWRPIIMIRSGSIGQKLWWLRLEHNYYRYEVGYYWMINLAFCSHKLWQSLPNKKVIISYISSIQNMHINSWRLSHI